MFHYLAGGDFPVQRIPVSLFWMVFVVPVTMVAIALVIAIALVARRRQAGEAQQDQDGWKPFLRQNALWIGLGLLVLIALYLNMLAQSSPV